MAKIIKLRNGAVLLYHHNTQSKATAYRVGILRGGYLDKNTGISHLFEHMLFKGTSKHNNEELSTLIRDNFSNINASTAGDYMVIRSYESNKKLKSALAISSEMLLDSVFPEEELKKEKEVVRQEIVRTNDDIQRIATFNLNTMVYNYPEMKSKTLGDENKMMAIKRSQLLKYRKDNVIRENFIASVSSNLPAFVIKRYINKYFVDKLECGKANTFDPADLTINGDSKMIVDTLDRKKVVMKVALPSIGFEDVKESFLLSRVFSYASGIKGPLFNHFREKNQLVYSVSLRRWCNRHSGLIIFDIETSADKVNDCFYAIRDFVAEIKQGIVQKEVDRLNEKQDESEDRFVGHPMDYCANYMYDYMDRKEFIKPRVYKKLKKQVTKENLDRVIADNFNFDKIFISIVGPINKKDIFSMSKITKILKP